MYIYIRNHPINAPKKVREICYYGQYGPYISDLDKNTSVKMLP